MEHKLISNRFEVFLLILLCMIISTRLIWLQIEDRRTTITSEYYSSSLLFKQHFSKYCRANMDPNFPLEADRDTTQLDPAANVSPALVVSFLALCQHQKLSLEGWLSIGPQLSVFTSFLVALTARILTRNWVAGVLAAAVYLSRGSLITVAHTASSASLLHPLITLFFLVAALYTRTKEQGLIPIMNILLVFCTFVSPLFGLVAWMPLLGLVPYLYRKAKIEAKALEEFLPGIVSTFIATIAIPGVIFTIHKILPGATLPCSAIARQFMQLALHPSGIPKLIGAVIAELEVQDFHWQTSVAVLALATTWRRFLPSGSGAWSGGLLLLILSALLADASLIGEAARQTYEVSVIRYFKMATAVTSLEPVVIGGSAALAWFAAKRFLTYVYTNYES